MAKQAIVQIRMDADTREKVEELYRNLGTSFAEAVRIFANKSLKENGFPFAVKDTKTRRKSARGILAEYASDELMKTEKNAFEIAMREKYGE